jgi:hypothetical protein
MVLVRGDGLGELPHGSTLSLARLVCEHGTVVWVALGPARITLGTEPSMAMRQGCGCRMSTAFIFPDVTEDRP